MEPYNLYLRHPEWNRPDDPEFAEHYSSIVNLRYSLRDRVHKKQFIGPKGKCSLCGKSAPNVNFSQEKHLLPAAIGNWVYFSNEECNSCNTDFGLTTENALARMLAMEQALYRVPTRKGTAKLKPRPDLDEKGSFLGSASPNDALEVKTFLADDSVYIDFKQDNHFTLTATAPSYKQKLALKSILKSFWLACQRNDIREQFDFIRQYIKSKDSIFETHMLSFFVPRDTNDVSFQAWLRQPNSNIPTAPLVIRLLFGSTCIIWCAPEARLSQDAVLTHGPSLLPRVELLEPRAHLAAYKIVCNSEDESIQRHTRSYHFQYSASIFNGIKQDQAISMAHLPKMVAVAEVIKDGTPVSSINTVLSVERYDEGGVRFHIEGFDLAASLLFEYKPNEKRVIFEELLKLSDYSLRTVIATLDFLQFAYKKEATLRIRVVLDGSRDVLFVDGFPFYRDSALPTYFDPLRRFAELLSEINMALNMDVRLPKPGEDFPFVEAGRLVQILRTGETMDAGEIAIQVPSAAVEEFYAANKDTSAEISFTEPVGCVEFLGHTIVLGACQYSVPDAVLVTQYDQATELARQAEFVQLRFQSEHVTKRYDNWIKGKQS